LSRVANSIYWMSRYVERAENVARFIDVNLQLVLDSPAGGEQQWQSLVNATGDQDDFARRYGAVTQENVLAFLMFDLRNPNSILSCVQSARENGRSIREIISSEMWLQLNKFYLMVKSAAPAPRDLDLAIELFQDVKLASLLFAGIADATMTHGTGWHFLQVGRMIERADKASRILDVKNDPPAGKANEVENPFDNIQWGAVLRSASAFEMYCKKHSRVSPRHALQFLMLDREFPRSILFCLMAARISLQTICGAPPKSARSEPQRLLGRLCSDLEFASADDLQHSGLHEYVDKFQKKLNQADQAISAQFFAMNQEPALAADYSMFGGVKTG